MAPVHGPPEPQKRQKTVLTVSASLVPGDARGAGASGSCNSSRRATPPHKPTYTPTPTPTSRPTLVPRCRRGPRLVPAVPVPLAGRVHHHHRPSCRYRPCHRPNRRYRPWGYRPWGFPSRLHVDPGLRPCPSNFLLALSACWRPQSLLGRAWMRSPPSIPTSYAQLTEQLQQRLSERMRSPQPCPTPCRLLGPAQGGQTGQTC